MNFSLNKPIITFYEKPGCAGNARQKKLLKQCGYELDIRNMLSTDWNVDELQEFFFGLDNSEIVNNSAPDIKNSIINVNKHNKDDLIKLMIENPILIKRPLMVIGNHKLCGFDTNRLSKLLNVDIDSLKNISTCTNDDVCKSV